MGLRKQPQLSTQCSPDCRMPTLTSPAYRLVPGAVSHRLLRDCIADAAATADSIRRQRGRGLYARFDRVAARGYQSADDTEQVDYRYAEECETQS